MGGKVSEIGFGKHKEMGRGRVLLPYEEVIPNYLRSKSDG